MVATERRTETGPPPQAVVAAERIVRPRRGLPGSRAVVGGLLVALAGVGTFAAWSGAQRSPSSRYVVAAHAVAGGAVLGRSDLKTVAIDLPAGMAGHSYRDVAGLLHAVTLGPLQPGELVQSGNVVPARGATPHPEFSFGIDVERAVAGTLRPGEEIDILVTYGTGAGSTTQLVSPNARVVSVEGGSGNGLSDARRQVLTVAVSSSDDILELTNATRAGEITVARSTGVADAPAMRTFQPQVPEAGTTTAPPQSQPR